MRASNARIGYAERERARQSQGAGEIKKKHLILPLRRGEIDKQAAAAHYEMNSCCFFERLMDSSWLEREKDKTTMGGARERGDVIGNVLTRYDAL